MKRVLIVEDEAQVLGVLSRIVTDMGLVSITASSVASGLAQIGPHIDMILLDLQLPNGHGFQILEAIADRRNDIPVIVVSAHEEDRTHESPVQILDWIGKPITRKKLCEAIERGCHFSTSLDRIRQATARLERSGGEVARGRLAMGT